MDFRFRFSFLVGLCAASLSHAQTDPAAVVVVTGARVPQAAADLVADVLVINEARIRASLADSLEDLLRREGGMQLSRNGGSGQSAGLMLRGTSAASVVVLIDGVRVGGATAGQVDFASLSLAQVARIEVLRGPGSSLYGADAVGGVVQIFTRSGQGPAQVDAFMRAGNLGSGEVAAGLRGRSGGWDYALGASHEASDGVNAVKPGDTFGLHNPDRDGFARDAATLRAGFAFSPGTRLGLALTHSQLRAQFDSAEYLPPTFSPDATPDFRSRTQASTAALDFKAELSPRWATQAMAAVQRDDYQSGASQVSRYQTRREQLQWQGLFKPAPGQQAVLALDHVDERITSTDYTAPARRNLGAVLGYSGAFGTQRVQADVRHDRNSVYGNVNTGKLGWGWQASDAFSLRAMAGTAFRAPAFNDLYYPGYGVASIRPERSRSVDLGARWQLGASRLDATLYRNRVSDLIGYQADPAACPPGYPTGCAGNVARARLQGATLALAQRVAAWHFEVAIDFLDAKDAASGQRLPRRAPHQERLGAQWSQGAWAAAAQLLSVGARSEGDQVQAAYQTLDLSGQFKLGGGWQLEARLNNATGRAYEPVLDAMAPGRQGWLGLRYRGL